MLKNQINLNNLDLDQLHTLEEHLESFLFTQKPIGEPFHPNYKKDKDFFKKFVKSTQKFKKHLDQFFKDQFSRIDILVNLYKVRADEEGQLNEEEWLNIQYWDQENVKLSAEIHIDLSKIFDLTAALTQKQFNFDIGLDVSDLPVQQFLSQYSLKLAGEINQVTRDKIIQQIKTSLALGEDRNGLTARIEPIINDPKRAARIAQTESIRAYSEGKLAVGKRIGVKRKKWVTYLAIDEACLGAMEQGPIDIDEPFDNGEMGPPAHPHCRCVLELDFDPATDQLDWSQTGTNLLDFSK